MTENVRTLSVVTPATTTPVSVDEVKAFARITGSDEDALITLLLKGAVDAAQRYCRRFFVNTTVKLTLDRIADGKWSDFDLVLGEGVHEAIDFRSLCGDDILHMPCPPIQSVTWVKSYGPDNASETFASAAYRLDGADGRLCLNDGYTWPTNLRRRQAIEIQFVAGYGADGDSVPAAIRSAILKFAAAAVDCRSVCEMPEACKAELSPYRLVDGLGWAQ